MRLPNCRITQVFNHLINERDYLNVSHLLIQEWSRFRTRHVHADGPRQSGITLSQRCHPGASLFPRHGAWGSPLRRRLRRPDQTRLYCSSVRWNDAPEDSGGNNEDHPEQTSICESGLNTFPENLISGWK